MTRNFESSNWIGGCLAIAVASSWLAACSSAGRDAETTGERAAHAAFSGGAASAPSTGGGSSDSTASGSASDAPYVLGGVTPDPAMPGSQVTVTWTAPSDHSATDWVAMAAASAPNTGYLKWRWVPAGTTGTLTFVIDSGLATGAYEFRYFTNDSFDKVSTVAFTVSDGGSSSYGLTSVTPDPVTPGSQATVTWTAPSDHSATDWVSMASAGAADTAYLKWQWVPAGTTGTLTFVIDSGLATGSYELRYFTNDTFQKVAMVGFTVGSPGFSYSLAGVTPDPVAPGSQVTVTWTASSGRSAKDWVAMAVAGAPDTAYLKWQWVPAGTNGTLTFVIDSGLATGSYELRYFINDTFQKAASVAFAVTDSVTPDAGSTQADAGAQDHFDDAGPDGPSVETVVVTAIGTSTTTTTTTGSSVATDTQIVTGTKSHTASATVTGTYTGTRTGTLTSSGTVVASKTQTGTKTWSGTYSGVGTAQGTTKGFTATLTATTTVRGTLTITATGTNTKSATSTATGSSVGTGTKTATQTYTFVPTLTTTQTYTSTQTASVLISRPSFDGVASGGGRGPLSSVIFTDHTFVDTLPSLSNQTVRVMLETTIGGSQVAVKLSNRFSAFPVSIGAAHLAIRGSGGSIASGTDRTMTFGGSSSVELSAGQEIWCDPVSLNVTAGQTLAISVYTPSQFTPTTEAGRGNPSWMNHYISSAGNYVSSATMPSGSTTRTILFVGEIRVLPASPAATLAALGDSITEGACSTSANGDWPDLLSARLRSLPDGTLVSVFNAGIGSGRFVTGDKAGLRGLSRLSYLLTLPHIRWVTLLMGVNDISYDGASDSDLISAYQQAIAMAHAAGVKIIGIPILPFRNSVKDDIEHRNWATAQKVNDWIRTPGNGYDAIIDFEPVIGDPADKGSFLSSMTCDHVHPNQAGYTAMANSIDLSIFQ
jgi:lysophospholipase L1-like esterase